MLLDEGDLLLEHTIAQRSRVVTADRYTHALLDYREIDRAKLLERARVVHPSVHTLEAGTAPFAGTF